MSAEWKHGLFGCFDNLGICIVTYLVPCYTHGKNAEAVGDSCFLCGIAALIPLINIILCGLNRKKVREKKGIDGGVCGDMMATLFCTVCSLAQVAQEVDMMNQSVGVDDIERE